MSLKFIFSATFVLSMLSPMTMFNKNSTNVEVPETPVKRTIRRANTYKDRVTIHVLSSEDYIYLNDTDEGYDNPDLVDQFIAYAKENGFENPAIVYDCKDTNETIYTELKTGKTNYDVVNTSDYMAQKLVSEDIAVPFSEEDKLLMSNYFGENASASRRLRETLGNIYVPSKDVYLEDYAVGYMWGTLGMLVNPSYKRFDEKHRNISMDELAEDLRSWNLLWDEKYNHTLTVKDSIRDTYAVGILYTYQDELKEIQDKYFEDRETDPEGALKTYQDKFSEIFNRCEQENIDEVYPNLRSLKTNSFGLEVDQGKQDIVTGKIGINLAWSGDAVYAMDQAWDEKEQELYYSIPELGSNIWFDVWTMPKNPNRSQAQKELALLWLNFLSDPEYASQNMDYTGYTPFIGGDDILDLTRDWFDYRANYLYADEDGEVPVMYFDTDSEEEVELDYSDFLDTKTDNPELYYYDEDTKVPFTDPDSEEENPEPLHYNDLNDIIQELEEVDLTYFFDGTLSEDYSEDDMLFYSDGYLPFTYEDENGVEQQNICVGTSFFAQFPDEETMNRCVVMCDYGENNKFVMKMWENFKSDALPIWAVILFTIETAGIVGGVAYYFGRKKFRKDIRHKRKLAEKEA